MKKLILTLLCCALLFGMAACQKPESPSLPAEAVAVETALTADDLLDLGEKFLLELDYEQALVQFLKVIEIEPMNPRAIAGAVSSYVGRGTAAVLGGESEANLAKAQADFEAALVLDEKSEDAWLGLIDVYIRRGDYDKALELAKEALEKAGGEGVKAKLEELESGNVSDSSGQTRRTSTYDGDGSLRYYWDYTYDEKGRRSSVTSYDAGGSQTGYVDYENDTNGKQTQGSYYERNTGAMRPIELIYDDSGHNIKQIWYGENNSIHRTLTYTYNSNGLATEIRWMDENGVQTQRDTFEYNSNNNRTRRDVYQGSEDLHSSYEIYEYNERGQRIRQNSYKNDGSLNNYTINKYDENGQHIGSEHYNADGTLRSSTVNE